MKILAFVSLGVLTTVIPSLASEQQNLREEVYRSLQPTAYKPSYQNLTFNEEKEPEETQKTIVSSLSESAYKPQYDKEKVIKIDHKGEVITIKKKENK